MGYLLPFDAEKYGVKILQGHHGPYSHFDHEGRYGVLNDQSYAVDFILPLGAEVHAARGGHVSGLLMASNYCYEGTDERIGNNLGIFATNILIIKHGDETYALYSHLARRGAHVSVGQYVEQGVVVAYTGKSGWIGPNPHLHFAVFQYMPRSDKSRKKVTQPIAFRNYDGPLEHTALASGDTGDRHV